jgi:hypothetical protein
MATLCHKPNLNVFPNKQLIIILSVEEKGSFLLDPIARRRKQHFSS